MTEGGRYFQPARRGELQDLREELHSTNREKKKEAVKKVIAAMTVGKDVSSLFPDVVNCMQTPNLELKKLVYLYVINYAKAQPELAILAVNTFRKDSLDPNPLVRALAIRTMACIRLEDIAEYLIEPLRRSCKDPDPYVRKTAAIAVTKVYDIRPDMIEEEGFLEALTTMLGDNNPVVIANSVAALSEISEKSKKNYLADTLNKNEHTVNRLLAALNECTEWGQVFILDALAQLTPGSPHVAESVIERVTARLSHANSAVVLSAIKVIMKLLDRVTNPEVVRTVQRKLCPPLVTLLSAEPEIQYIALRNIDLIVQKRPNILANEIKMFFCKYNDPLYVKLEKLEVLVRLASEKNVDQVVNELKEYVVEVDVEFVRKAVRCVGRCALKIECAAGRCLSVLLELLQSKVNYVVQEAIVVIKDIFRKYPTKFDALIPRLCEDLDTLYEPAAKASMVWILGEYVERIPQAEELLGRFLERFVEEPATVQLQLLTAAVKMYLKRPTHTKKLVTAVLEKATDEGFNADLRDRAYIYWRMLSRDPDASKKVILAPKPPINDDADALNYETLDVLIENIAMLASVYHRLPDTFTPPVPHTQAAPLLLLSAAGQQQQKQKSLPPPGPTGAATKTTRKSTRTTKQKKSGPAPPPLYFVQQASTAASLEKGGRTGEGKVFAGDDDSGGSGSFDGGNPAAGAFNHHKSSNPATFTSTSSSRRGGGGNGRNEEVGAAAASDNDEEDDEVLGRRRGLSNSSARKEGKSHETTTAAGTRGLTNTTPTTSMNTPTLNPPLFGGTTNTSTLGSGRSTRKSGSTGGRRGKEGDDEEEEEEEEGEEVDEEEEEEEEEDEEEEEERDDVGEEDAYDVDDDDDGPEGGKASLRAKRGGGRVRGGGKHLDEDGESEADEDVLVELAKKGGKGRRPAPGARRWSSRKNKNNRLKADDSMDLLGLDDDPPEVRATRTHTVKGILQKRTVLSVDQPGTRQTRGLQIDAAFQRTAGKILLHMTFFNRLPSNAILTDWGIQFNRNSFGLSPAQPLLLPPLSSGASVDATLLVQPGLLYSNTPPVLPLALQVAVKTNVDEFYFFVPYDFSIVLQENFSVEKAAFRETWMRLGEQRQSVCMAVSAAPLAAAAVAELIQQANISVVAQWTTYTFDTHYVIAKTVNELLLLAEISVQKDGNLLKLVVRTESAALVPLFNSTVCNVLNLTPQSRPRA